ncbi:MAG: nucleotidyl transferase AbiEii/AbiGii toxin family protein [Sediminibacterium sp. Gen4]|nr:nucleotidyl transferase AbiEii/AbiGii toxin family protein [Sediminibacterium sp. Gen4]
MLYYDTIDTPTLELLRRLLAIPSFSSLRLAGGTSLALQYGHRKSVDIDLFGSMALDGDTLSNVLSEVGEVKRLN